MKFAVYEVREDEKKMLNTLAERHHLELALTAGPLTPENPFAGGRGAGHLDAGAVAYEPGRCLSEQWRKWASMPIPPAASG